MITLNIGDTRPSVPTVTDNRGASLPYSSGTYILTWAIDTTGVIGVSEANFQVTALAAGTVTITWTATPKGGTQYAGTPPVSFTDELITVLPPPQFTSLAVTH